MPIAESLRVDCAWPPLTELADAGRAIFSGFNDRSMRVLQSRVLALENQLTLEQLGKEFGKTRERIRQIESSAIKKIDKRLTLPQYAPVAHAAKSLSKQLGVMVSPGRYEELSALFLGSNATCTTPLLLPLLLWVGGPFAFSNRWLMRKPVADSVRAVEDLLPASGERKPVAELEQDLRGTVSLQPGELPILVSDFGCRVFGDNVVAWRGNLGDKASLVLEFHGRPMTREEISAAISEEHNIRTLGNRLFDDGRFVRINLTEFALASWGASAYKGIVQELVSEIHCSGGEASLGHLKSRLERFGVSERSIISYLNSPVFARTTRGSYRVRREDEDVIVQSRVELTRSCFRIDGHWGFRFQIDDELVRGSGRNLPAGFAQAVGIGPGSANIYNSRFGEYRMSWPGAQPTAGSIRRFIEFFDLALSDWLYVVPMGGEIRAIPLKARELSELSDLECLFRQCCPTQPIDKTDLQEAIADSIGLSECAGWAPIKCRFLERRETALCSLVPDDPAEQDGIDMFADLLEYVR